MTHFATILNSTLYLLLSLALSMLAISLAVFILKALWDYQFPTHQVNQSVTRLELAFLAVASVGGLIYTNLVYSWATAFYEANTKPSFLVQVVSTTSGLLGSSSQLLYNGVISAKQTIVGRSMLGQLWENVETTLQLGFSILKAPMNIIQSVFGLVIFIVNVVLNLGLFAIVPAVLMYSIYNHPTTVSAGLSSVYNSLHNNFNDRNNPPPPVFPTNVVPPVDPYLTIQELTSRIYALEDRLRNVNANIGSPTDTQSVTTPTRTQTNTGLTF